MIALDILADGRLRSRLLERVPAWSLFANRSRSCPAPSEDRRSSSFQVACARHAANVSCVADETRPYAQAGILATHVYVLYTNRLGPSFHPFCSLTPTMYVKMDSLDYFKSVYWARIINISQNPPHLLPNSSHGLQLIDTAPLCRTLVVWHVKESSQGNRKPSP